MEQQREAIESFVAGWPETGEPCRTAFKILYDFLDGLKQVRLEFHPRPGVTYSLRAAHPETEARPLFGMIDVIEDEPRWLSICFYAEMISDPEDQGNVVPGGLLGEDGHCFDIETGDEALVDYVKERLLEAYHSAGGQA